ncbi:hypothetical protein EZV62_022156 [Acer yangbiense]|uniref:Uncharacterized protein n=1 Tax=Acer yangbiense TaxID=1000413 RepID=A0A5C7H7P1_9ROSI|nr:hypothetical protein EZV62_022156 [Acer yangbiense]
MKRRSLWSRPAESHDRPLLERSYRVDQIKVALGYEGGFGVDSNGSSGGLLLLWKDNCSEDIGRVVTESWEENGPSVSIEDLRAKLERYAVNLTGWSMTRFGKTRKQIEEKNREIEFLYKRCKKDGIMQRIKSLERSVESLMENDELYWC